RELRPLFGRLRPHHPDRKRSMNDPVNAVAAMAAPAPASPKRGDDPPTDAFETALGSAAATESPPGPNATKARTADAGGSKAEGDSSDLTDTDKRTGSGTTAAAAAEAPAATVLAQLAALAAAPAPAPAAQPAVKAVTTASGT